MLTETFGEEKRGGERRAESGEREREDGGPPKGAILGLVVL